MVEKLPANEGRYVVYDYHVETEDGRKGNKLVLVYWCPQTLKVPEKMIMSTNKTVIQGKLDCPLQLIADCKAEVDESEIARLVKSKL